MAEQRGVVLFADPWASRSGGKAEEAARGWGLTCGSRQTRTSSWRSSPRRRCWSPSRRRSPPPIWPPRRAAPFQVLEWRSPEVDREAAAARGIAVVDVPSLSMLGVAEHTILLMLSLVKQFPSTLTRTLAGGVAGVEEVKTTARAMSYNWLGQHDLGWLYRKRLGIIGLGKIGRAVAARANAFGMRVSTPRAIVSTRRRSGGSASPTRRSTTCWRAPTSSPCMPSSPGERAHARGRGVRPDAADPTSSTPRAAGWSTRRP